MMHGPARMRGEQSARSSEPELRPVRNGASWDSAPGVLVGHERHPDLPAWCGAGGASLEQHEVEGGLEAPEGRLVVRETRKVKNYLCGTVKA